MRDGWPVPREFNADDAKALAEASLAKFANIDSILAKIQEEAGKGKRFLHVNLTDWPLEQRYSVSVMIQTEMERRKFKVTKPSGTVDMREIGTRDYHKSQEYLTITW